MADLRWIGAAGRRRVIRAGPLCGDRPAADDPGNWHRGACVGRHCRDLVAGPGTPKAGIEARLALNVRSYRASSDFCFDVVRRAMPSSIKGMFNMTRIVPIITN